MKFAQCSLIISVNGEYTGASCEGGIISSEEGVSRENNIFTGNFPTETLHGEGLDFLE